MYKVDSNWLWVYKNPEKKCYILLEGEVIFVDEDGEETFKLKRENKNILKNFFSNPIKFTFSRKHVFLDKGVEIKGKKDDPFSTIRLFYTSNYLPSEIVIYTKEEKIKFEFKSFLKLEKKLRIPQLKQKYCDFVKNE